MSRRRLYFSAPSARLANTPVGDFAQWESQIRHGADPAAGTDASAASRAWLAANRQLWRDWIRRAGEVDATTPMWRSRSSFVCDCAAWASTDEGRAVLKRFSLSARMWARVIPALARFADGATGRHCAVATAVSP